MAGLAVANGSFGFNRARSFRVRASSLRHLLRSMVGKLASFSRRTSFSYFIVSLASYGLWHVRPVHLCFVHGEVVCLFILIASHVSLDTSVRGISSWSSLCVYIYVQQSMFCKFTRRIGEVKVEGVTLSFENGECTGDGARRTRSLRSEERTHHPSCWARHLESRLR